MFKDKTIVGAAVLFSGREQEKKLKDCLNEAMNDAKLQMAKQAQSMGGFGL